ncbi:MAG TPA: hypothetical protein VFR09_01140 [Alphaproteobacteria bacterium]|nr:hypothetical protein [Alphaproteobacteria bacterium]
MRPLEYREAASTINGNGKIPTVTQILLFGAVIPERSDLNWLTQLPREQTTRLKQAAYLALQSGASIITTRPAKNGWHLGLRLRESGNSDCHETFFSKTGDFSGLRARLKDIGGVVKGVNFQNPGATPTVAQLMRLAA